MTASRPSVQYVRTYQGWISRIRQLPGDGHQLRFGSARVVQPITDNCAIVADDPVAGRPRSSVRLCNTKVLVSFRERIKAVGLPAQPELTVSQTKVPE